jgi:signal transduction histidine kinase/CheY-like chemotaxis protein
MQLNLKILLSLFLIIIFNLFVFTNQSKASNNIAIKEGILDLSNHNFYDTKFVDLSGEWEYYPNKILKPEEIDSYKQNKTYTYFPSLWKSEGFLTPSFGIATYRLKVKLNSNSIMGVYMPDVYTSYNLWINGKLISKNGIVSDKNETFTPEWLPKTSPFLAEKENIIVVQISNFSHHKGGATKSIKIGNWENISKESDLENNLSVFLTGFIIMSSLFFLGLYYFGNKEKYVLYFAIFCIFYGYRVIGTENYFLHRLLYENMWFTLIRFEYLTLFLSSYMLIKFLENLYPEDIIKNINKTIEIVCLLFSISIILPTYIFTAFINQFIIFVLFCNLYIIYLFFTAYKNKRDGAIFAVISVAFLILTISINSLAYFGIIQRQYLLEFIGYTLFFFFQSLILSYRFSISFKRAMVQAESGVKARELFLATVSHELRTPMNGVIGMTDLLHSTKLSIEQMEYVKTIRESGETLLRIINDILDYSKFESGNINLEEEEFEIENLCDEVSRMFLPSISISQNKLYFIISPEIPNTLYADASRIRQILINLINNANKFTKNGYIKVLIDLISTEEDIVTLCFKVQDSGVGIPKEKINALFKPFSQVHENKFGGTGLGLIICKILVNAMKGDVSVESEEGKGSIFKFDLKIGFIKKEIELNKDIFIDLFIDNNDLKLSLENYFIRNKIDYVNDIDILDNENRNIVVITDDVYYKKVLTNFINKKVKIICIQTKELKLVYDKRITLISTPIIFSEIKNLLSEKKSEVTIIKESIEVSLMKESIKVLLVDDNEINLKVGASLIHKLGYELDTARDGAEAYKSFTDKNYDIIFMDVDMPIMNGLESTKKIRAYTLDNEYPIIVAMTANAMQGDRERCIEVGMNDYISKPVKIDNLKSIINKWIFGV